MMLSPDEIPAGTKWRKAGRSVGEGACVEVAALPDGELAIHNSNRLHQGALTYSRAEFAAFAGGIKDGDFDDLLT